MKKEWIYKKLGEVCDIYNGNSINADYKKQHFYGAEGGLPFIATKDVSTIGTIDYNNGVRIPNYEDYKIAPANSVFICAEGGSAGKKFAYVEQDVCFGNKLFCLNPKIDSLFGKFVYHYIQSDVFKEQFYSLLSGLIGGVSAKKFQSIEIPVPPLSEQHSIVSRLDAAFANIDALKANAEKQLSEARKLFQAELTECMRPKEGWEEKTLGELATDMYRGSGIKRDQVTKDGVPCVRYGEIYTTYNMAFEECVSHVHEELISSPKYFEHGDLLFAITGESVEDIGKTIAYLGKEKCLCGGDIICMKHKQNAKFLSYALSTPDAIRQKGVGKTKLKVVHTNAPALKAISVPVPALSVQHQIVTRLDALSAWVRQLEKVQRKILAECDALKQAMLREVFE